MKILAIETSCDETAVALLDIREKGRSTTVRILGNALLSQTPIHALMGGVVPSLAKREHANNLIPMLTLCLERAGLLSPVVTPKAFTPALEKKLHTLFSHEPELATAFIDFIPTIKKIKIDKIAVTMGPGLEPALWVGINFARALNLVWKTPVVPVNHMEGHILSSLLVKKEGGAYSLDKAKLPLLSLLISGGHTELVLAKKVGAYKVIGETRDDAVGEAFDKVARMLGLPYPGGPHISKLAEDARANDIKSFFTFPRPMIESDDLDFSFSGLKTAVLYTIQKIQMLSDEQKMHVALAFEDAATDVLVSKVKKALLKTKAKTVAVGGGVIANKNIRTQLRDMMGKDFPSVALYLPTPDLTTDNAVMIGLAGYFKKGGGKKLAAKGTWRLG